MAAEPVRQRDRPFHDPAVDTRAGGDVRGDPEPANLVPVDLVVNQRDRSGDVVAVAANGDRRERDAVRLDDQVVLAAGRRRLRGTAGSGGSTRAHNSSSISQRLAAVFLVPTGSHPLRPASTRTDTPSFPEIHKPPSVRSRKPKAQASRAAPALRAVASNPVAAASAARRRSADAGSRDSRGGATAAPPPEAGPGPPVVRLRRTTVARPVARTSDEAQRIPMRRSSDLYQGSSV